MDRAARCGRGLTRTMPHRAGSVARILLAAALLFATSFAAIEPTAVVAQPRSDDFLLERAADASRLQDLLSSHTPAKTWFRLEEPGYPPVELAFGGASSGRLLSLGSVSKTVTGIGIALLIQEGRIELNTKMKDILGEYFVEHGSRLDPSLDDITVERLLTHRAGLRGNLISDPAHGLATAEVTSKVGGETEFFDYLAASREVRSDRSSKFLYSNLSYLILGMVIEAASGQKYAEFCQQSVLRPMGITDAVIPAEWTIVGPFGGWRMTLADVLKLRETFDLYHPSILDRRTLERTILGKLGGS